MSMTLLNFRLKSIITLIKRSAVIQSNFDFANKMKVFNANKEFTKTVELYDKFINKDIEKHSTALIIQVLKACTHTRDLQRASTIHRLLSSRINNDFQIAALFIHLYSKFPKDTITFISIFFCNVAQCGDMKSATKLFNTITQKNLPIYGMMMKGKIFNIYRYIL